MLDSRQCEMMILEMGLREMEWRQEITYLKIVAEARGWSKTGR